MQYYVSSLGRREEMPLPPGVTITMSSENVATHEHISAPASLQAVGTIAFENVSKTFRTRARVVAAVDTVNLSVVKGEIVALVGPNGAGKTTLIKLLCGLVTPDAGKISIDGISTSDNPAVRRKIGLALEGGRDFYGLLTVRENLAYFSALMGLDDEARAARVPLAMSQFGISDLSNVQGRHLSKGQKQRLSLALSLVHDPDFLVLDEPTLGLDPTALEDLCVLFAALRDRGVGILFSSHDLTTVEEVADRVVIIADGAVRHQERIADWSGQGERKRLHALYKKYSKEV